eukprot:TRINITY_DN35691_c0_g1_i4.p1 TRINITY_DN35691_c0_g1~~TRINITY_DN35691_c0_g1_i4.p1  ORF type:complete len:120 (+),score=5.23 TRINITY_DN35691_c0_g1_i4:935-1294(+)
MIIEALFLHFRVDFESSTFPLDHVYNFINICACIYTYLIVVKCKAMRRTHNSKLNNVSNSYRTHTSKSFIEVKHHHALLVSWSGTCVWLHEFDSLVKLKPKEKKKQKKEKKGEKEVKYQ